MANPLLVSMCNTSNSSAKERARRFKDAKWTKGNRNGGQEWGPCWFVWGFYPDLDRCSGHSLVSYTGRLEGDFVEWGEVRLSPGKLRATAGCAAWPSAPSLLLGQAPLWGMQVAQPQAGALARRRNLNFTTSCGDWWRRTFIKRQGKKTFAPFLLLLEFMFPDITLNTPMCLRSSNGWDTGMCTHHNCLACSLHLFCLCTQNLPFSPSLSPPLFPCFPDINKKQDDGWVCGICVAELPFEK